MAAIWSSHEGFSFEHNLLQWKGTQSQVGLLVAMKSTKLFLLFVWLAVVALACNLAGSDPPPTIVPRSPVVTPQQQPTLGFQTPIPGQENEPTTLPLDESVEVEMFNMMNQVEADRLMLHIATLVNFHSRHVNSPVDSLDRGIGAAFNYLYQQFLSIQAQNPNFTVFPNGHPFTMPGASEQQRNVIAYLQGTETGAGIIVVGAHYDSRADNLDDSVGAAPGADDNGSGVAAVIELARILAPRPQRSTIIFALFAGEEQGNYGSTAFVQEYLLGSNNISPDYTYMINLDTIGSWNDSNGNINDRDIRLFSPPPNDSRSRQLARTMQFIGFNHELALNIVMVDAIDREGRWGDHLSFVDNGYPAVRFIEYFEDHAFRESRDYLDRVEPEYLVKSTRTVLGVILSLAGGPRPPRNMTLRENGNGEGQLVWEAVPGAAQYIVALRRQGSLEVSQQFVVTESKVDSWDGWWRYEAVSVAAVDARGLIGPLSDEFHITTQ